MPDPKRIPILKEVCSQLYNDAFDLLKNYILINYGSNYSDDPSKAKIFLDNKAKSFVWTYRDPFDKSYLSNTVLGIDRGFFTRKIKEAGKASPLPTDFNLDLLKILLGKLGFYEPPKAFFDCLLDYIDKLGTEERIPGNIHRSQRQLIRGKRLFSDKEEETDSSSTTVISGEYTKNLIGNSIDGTTGSQWWFYFYGYETLDEPKNESGWKLIRLLLTFSKNNSDDLTVSITNTDHSKHYHYIGETDFTTSSAKVLVMNLRTVARPKRRQLNVKMFMDLADGSFFLGQYLNYEVTTGRIYSGVVVMEMVEEKNIKPIPNTYLIPYSKNYSESLRDVLHVIPFFEDIERSFRSTETYKFKVVTDSQLVNYESVNVKSLVKKEKNST